MRLARILSIATAVELTAAGAGPLLAGALGGGASGWLDVLNSFAPVWLVLAATGGAASVLILPKGAARRGTLALALAGTAAGGALIGPEVVAVLAPPAAVSPGGAPLKVTSFNVWMENIDPAATARAILASDADVVALQENDGAMRRALPALASAYPYSARCEPGWRCGVLLLSRRPILASGFMVPDYPSRKAQVGLAWVRIAAPDGRPAVVATTHLFWPVPPGPQRAQSAALAAYLRRFAGEDMILAGDFNLTPWSYAMRRQDRALAPLSRRTHGLMTYPAVIPRLDRPAPLAFLAIDQLYASPAWRTLSLKRLPRAGSDHFGLSAAFAR